MPNLVGIGNSQVPTNAMLGGLAYQDSVGEINIEKIKARTSDTATAIFVYDTRKDSDGGAWRHRTQNLSWYNEGVNQYRGARKEFPAVAVIVAEENPAYKVTIYDGDDPNMSLWMQWISVTNTPFFNYATPGSHHLGNYAPVSISAVNGIICVGTFRSSGSLDNLNAGIREFHFIKDECFATNNDKRVKLPTSIADRNVVSVFYVQSSLESIIDSNVRDVTMTVQPNAPIDESTGLPIPTITVGTDGGVSVIQNNPENNKRIVNLTGFSPVTFVEANEKGLVGALGGTSSHDFIFKTNFPQSISEAFNTQIAGDNGNYYMNSNSGTTPLLRDLNMTAMTFNPSDGTVYRGGDNGFDIITKTETVSSNSNISLISYVDTDYNSGYMVGNIKGAFLSSTDDTNVTASELVTNGTFASNNVTGWTERESGGSFTASGGQATLTYSSGVASWKQDITIVSGKTYTLSFQVISTTTSSIQFYYNHGTGTDINVSMDGTAGTYSATFTAASNSVEIFPRIFNSGNMVLDNISLRIAEDDRSINNKGLQVFGTVTKSAVATGAELTSYGGFANNNYLQQPYNSDLNFGTGDLSIIFWYKMTSSGTTQCLLHRGDGGSGTWGSGNIIQIEMDTTNMELQLSASAFSSFDEIQVPVAKSVTGQWQHFVGVRKGGRAYIYIDGVRYGNVASSRDLSNTAAKTWIGQRPNVNRPATNTSMALLRMSPSAPTEEQVIKMYNDEKHLFDENAKCTISGATSAVKALGFDDSTDTVYVGTSSGRSDFRGLNRINNTTTAVTTAISASNELVAEQ